MHPSAPINQLLRPGAYLAAADALNSTNGVRPGLIIAFAVHGTLSARDPPQSRAPTDGSWGRLHAQAIDNGCTLLKMSCFYFGAYPRVLRRQVAEESAGLNSFGPPARKRLR